jgi:hypothetical protein
MRQRLPGHVRQRCARFAARSVWIDAIAEAVAVFVEEECGACVQVHHRAAIGLEAAVDV